MVRDDEDGEMSPEEIMKMDWLADIVVGSIPTLDELVEDARDVVTFQGVNTPENLELKKTTDIV